MYPIQTLPSELILEIFQLAVDPQEESEFYSKGRRGLRAALVLSQVCAQWRRLAQTTPQLWTLQSFPVEVVKSNKSGAARKISMDATKACLDRSGSLLISVHLRGLTQDAAAPFLKELICHSHRWRTLSLSMASISALAEISPGGLNGLESVDLSLRGGSTPDPLHSKLTTFLAAPRLRSVNLGAHYLPFLPMPWPQLTHLTLSGHHSPQPYLDTLLLCPQLVVAELEMMGWTHSGSPPASDIGTVTLPRLVKLGLYLHILTEGEHLTPLLRLLNLPALKTLIVRLDDDVRDFRWSVLDFTQFQLRSPYIERIDLISCSPASADLQSLLLHAVNLKHLELIDCPNCINDSLFLGLLYDASDSVHVAPKLETLVLASTDSDFDEDTLECMISSRWWTDDELNAMSGPPAVARWKRIALGMEDQDYSGYFIDDVKRFREQGLNLQGYLPERVESSEVDEGGSDKEGSVEQYSDEEGSDEEGSVTLSF
ncbi:hypothetical protein B0H15DRAFT_1027842 [Mycena belliarum]|uniref:F-box domain-containing protein n=1 Tax=Mycena belliarum TaxID=1033014 RepID=A0AAD6XG48_9AGAR|nr:hypothetical protein B0H15DRAFT_1027842 [Mycena belliae]